MVGQALQLLLLFALLGHVDGYAQHAQRGAAGIVGHGFAQVAQPALATMGQRDAPGGIEVGVGLGGVALQFAGDLGGVFRHHAVLPRLGAGGAFVARLQTAQVLPVGIALQGACGQVPVPAAQRCGGHGQREQGFALAHQGFGALGGVDVLHHAANAHDAAILNDGFAQRAHPDQAAIGAHDLNLQAPLHALADAPAQCVAEGVVPGRGHVALHVVLGQWAARGQAVDVVAHV